MPACSPSDNHTWKHCYTAALFQDDANQIPSLITQAEFEIMQRARFLFGALVDNAHELKALHKALRMLTLLKSCTDVALIARPYNDNSQVPTPKA